MATLLTAQGVWPLAKPKGRASSPATTASYPADPQSPSLRDPLNTYSYSAVTAATISGEMMPRTSAS